MGTSTRNLFVAAVLVSAVAVTATAQRLLADLSGRWTMVIAGPNGAYESAVVFKQEAEVLTGTIEDQMLGSAKLAGTVKGDTVKFSFSVDMQGNVVELKVGGMVKDKDNIAGQLGAPNGMGTFPFTAKRVP